MHVQKMRNYLTLTSIKVRNILPHGQKNSIKCGYSLHRFHIFWGCPRFTQNPTMIMSYSRVGHDHRVETKIAWVICHQAHYFRQRFTTCVQKMCTLDSGLYCKNVVCLSHVHQLDVRVSSTSVLYNLTDGIREPY